MVDALSLLLEADADLKVALEDEHNPLSTSLSPYEGHADANHCIDESELQLLM